MDFTGERYVPAIEGQIRYEHLHRYALCLQLVGGKTVLDIASGEGYGAATEASLSAMRLAARTEGPVLDPVYTGKAMAGLIDQARRGVVGEHSTVVFIHTGGLPALFAFKDEIITWLDRAPG